MECRTRDLHDFFDVARQTVDARKARCVIITYKTHIKNVRIFDHEKKNRFEKFAKFLSHNI